MDYTSVPNFMKIRRGRDFFLLIWHGMTLMVYTHTFAGIAVKNHVVGRHSKKLVTIVQFVIKAQNLVYVLKKSL